MSGRGVVHWMLAGGAAAAFMGFAQAAPEGRVLSVRTDPAPAQFGEVFELHVDLRFPAGARPVPPDTLARSDAVESAGAGSWSRTEVPGSDSVDVNASYPLIAFREGTVTLPVLELSFENPAGSRTVALGTTEVGPFAPLDAPGAEPVPRPTADVLGGNWNRWLFVGAAAAAGLSLWIGGSAFAATRRRGERDSSLHRPSPRTKALRELDRIRSAGWHRNGRIVDFYDATTGALRQYAEESDPVWSDALTSTELLQRLDSTTREPGFERLVDAVAVAERVKFGSLRPDVGRAEADWNAVRSWIRGTAPATDAGTDS